jgi:hypothetical protein
MAAGPGDDHFRTGWLRHLVAMHLGGVDPDRGDGVVELRCGDEPLTLIAHGGRVLTVSGVVGQPPDLVLTGPPDGVGGLVTGHLTPEQAADRGVVVEGDLAVLVAMRGGVGALG